MSTENYYFCFESRSQGISHASGCSWASKTRSLIFDEIWFIYFCSFMNFVPNVFYRKSCPIQEHEDSVQWFVPQNFTDLCYTFWSFIYVQLIFMFCELRIRVHIFGITLFVPYLHNSCMQSFHKTITLFPLNLLCNIFENGCSIYMSFYRISIWFQWPTTSDSWL
jgi:hypothetical protein